MFIIFMKEKQCFPAAITENTECTVEKTQVFLLYFPKKKLKAETWSL